MYHVKHFNDPLDTSTFEKVVKLYEGVHPIAPVIHEALTGSGVTHLFIVVDDEDGSVVGAGTLKTPEAAVPIGANATPIVWAIADMITHPSMRRQGIAESLLRNMESVASRNGGRILYLYTENDNEPAKRLYEKAGFDRLRDQGSQAVFAKLIKE
jgi:ribosomal protein S18 acetylase RimI-like enzyme